MVHAGSGWLSAMTAQEPRQAGLTTWSGVPARAADDGAEVAAVEVRLLVGDHVGLDVAEGRVGLVLDAVVEGLDDVFLEPRRAREGGDHGVADVITIAGRR